MSTRRSPALLFFLAVAMSPWACSRSDAPGRPLADGADAASSPSPSASPAALSTDKPDARAKANHAAPPADDGGARPETADEADARRRYRTAMTNGRLATMQKRYEMAMGAFDGALSAKKNDSRALAEKAYARLLSGKDPGLAKSELLEAAHNTKDPRLLSQIWFNLGLVEEDLHAMEASRVDFWMADHAFPSPSARSKLGTKKVCPVRVDRAWRATFPERTAVAAAGWLALSKALPSTSWDDDAAPKTDEEARKALAGENAPDTLPTIIVAGHEGASRAAFVVGKTQGGLHAIAVGAEVGGRCPGSVSFQIESAQGDRVHVFGTEVLEGGYGYMCTHADASAEAFGPCTDAEMANDTQQVQSYCAGGTATERDLVVDLRSGTVLLALERAQRGATDAEGVTAKLTSAGLSLTGLDCTGTTVAFSAPPSPDAGAAR